MRGDEKVIKHLNIILGNELVAINQYFLHSKMLADWGLKKIADEEYKESIDEMKHAEKLIERILFLGGTPSLELDGLDIGKDLKGILEADLKAEEKGVSDLKTAIQCAENSQDFVSRDLFQNILIEEEEHIDHLETYLKIMEQIGIQNFKQTLI